MKIRALIFTVCGLLMASLSAQETNDKKETPKPIVCEVVTQEGKPVVGAKIYLSCPGSRDYVLEDPIIAQGVTDAQGLFRTSCTPPPQSKFFIAFAVVDAGKDGIGLEMVPIRTPSQHASPEKHRIEVQPTADLKGTILTPDGKPAAGLEVWLQGFCLQKKTSGPEPGFFGDMSRLPGDLWKARTDTQGKFVMSMLPRNAHVYLKHDGSRWAQFKGRYHIMVEPLAKVDGSEPTLHLAEPGAIRGRILLPDGKPAAGSVVSILERDPYVTAYGDEVKANDRGEFIIPQIPASTYKVHYETQPPYFTRWIGAEKSGAIVKAGEVTDMGDLVVTEAAHITGEVVDAETGKVIEEPLTFRLAAGKHELRYRSQRYPKPEYHPPANDDTVDVQVKGGEEKKVTFKLRPVKPDELVVGVVLDEEGKPAANVRVAKLGNGGENFPSMRTTDQDGKFKMARERDASNEAVLAWTDRAMSHPEPVEPGKELTIKLREKDLGRVSGIVVDAAGNPIADAKIRWSVPQPVCLFGPVPQQVKSDVSGRFEFPRFWSGMEGVSFYCEAEAGLGNASERDVKVLSGVITELKFVMNKADKAVSGLLVDSEGKPLAGLMVYASGTGQPRNLKATTDMEGRFRITGMAPGRVHLRSIVKTEEFTSEAKKWASAGDTGVKLILPAANGEVSGTVVDASGKPVAMAKMESYGRGRKTSTDEAGAFKMSGLVDGWFTVQVEARHDDGERVELRERLKTGMKNAKLVLPAKNREVAALPAEPVDLIGKPAPQVEYTKWVNCEPLAPHGQGKVRILDFWGIECAPCIASFPKVQKFWEAHKDKDIEIVATTSFYPEQEVKEFLAKNPAYTFPVALRDDDSTAGRDYDVRGIPTYVVIDAAGKIVSTGHDFEEAGKVALRLVGKE
ncbi:carboxypeptidase regulatory-like domain-containing protein [Roseimicrobium sp. ORNL1]|uniref:carboxypeptidase regulatory-like domain-containing protein n=1 Tax=Roseimicrobium sp. ORNL1 TaxID=2711231 RepID=UPI0013E19141|nr:carboxypeptidase regulatory-like domain-containing protein [Roseimicrobium sp. ORNL1]QIF04336.1 redoxin family protein [Roseimicrobium sp. ORNL1]